MIGGMVTVPPGAAAGSPAAIQASSPPFNGRTFAKPASISRLATSAALASFGQLQ
jgi:hypothetical protein